MCLQELEHYSYAITPGAFLQAQGHVAIWHHVGHCMEFKGAHLYAVIPRHNIDISI